MSDKKVDLDEERDRRKTLKAAFESFDKQGNGYIGQEELKSLLKEWNVVVADDEIGIIFNEVDQDGNGKIEFEEFRLFMERDGMTDEQQLKETFCLFDKDGDGFISKHELKQTLRKLAPRMSDADIKNIFTEADENGDGKISFEEFKKFYTNYQKKFG